MKLKRIAALIAFAGISTSAFATNGSFAHGYGMKAKGMAGVGIAYGQDAIAAATNPANMVLLGNRWDAGADYFRPQRETKLTSAWGPSAGTYSGNDSEDYLVPEFGYNKMISNNMSLGVSVYGNGGMATDYGRLNTVNMVGGVPPVAPLGNGNAGIDLAQLFIAPTLSYKLNESHSIGVTFKLAYQRFEAFGLQNVCAGMSISAANCTNKGHDNSWGYGVGLGWTGQITPTLTLGATYHSRTYMTKLKDYKGLFAEKGGFDIPESYGIGFAWKATPQLTIAADIQQINYGDIRSIANKVNEGGGLGANNGAGFGWEDITAYKLGISYDWSKDLTLRGGYSWNDKPYDGDETFFNMLAPGVIKQHLTLGATWKLSGSSELTVAYMHAFDNTVKGRGNGINNSMYQDSFGIAYGVKF